MKRVVKQQKAPLTVAAVREAIEVRSRSGKQAKPSITRIKGKPSITFEDNDGHPLTVVGRQAQTLLLLVERGAHGFTSGEASPFGWARRTSHYISCLRKHGVQIETHRELATDGARIGRYILARPLRIIGEGV